MTQITALTLVHESKDTAFYAADPADDRCAITGTVSVQKWALPLPTPVALTLTLEALRTPEPLSSTQLVGDTRSARAGERTIPDGATVTIVKNRLADPQQPAEWLEQYLGRRGTVLWNTGGGAMVRLSKKEATWFPYAELAVGD